MPAASSIGSGSSYDYLEIDSGGALFDDNGYVGYGAGFFNTALITGAGSVWSNSATFNVGYLGSSGNQVVISDGAQLLDSNGRIGYNGGGTNTVVITGPGSVWKSTSPGPYSLGIGFNTPEQPHYQQWGNRPERLEHC